jgi:TfoX/Sxy family transcriptional regulator of competence genes
MPFDQTIADRVRPHLARRRGFTERKMFGGVGFLLDGHMCVGVWKHWLIARIGPEDYDAALAKSGVKEFDITGRPMKGWVMVDPSGVRGELELSAWVEQAVDFVRTLPPK